jgi:hypothetical protein
MVCKNKELVMELTNILQEAQSDKPNPYPDDSLWSGLEQIHAVMWEDAKKRHVQDTLQLISYREETLRSNYENRKHLIEQQIIAVEDENLRRMRQIELQNASMAFDAKMQELEELKNRTDIMTCRLVKGVLTVE